MKVLADPDTVARVVARWMLDLVLAKEGNFAVALSGGSTPRLLYQRLAEPPIRHAFPWSRTHWFWGDERFVPHQNARSNFRMARDAFLARVPVPAGHIHSIDTDFDSREAAAGAYENELKSFYGADTLSAERPLFDVTLLGLGPDGHTASLFPGSRVLDEQIHWVKAVVNAPTEDRITLTFPALESSHHVAFLVVGEGKREAYKRVCEGDFSLPAARLHPTGEEIWFLDQSVARTKG